jgi:hypothetical protein
VTAWPPKPGTLDLTDAELLADFTAWLSLTPSMLVMSSLVPEVLALSEVAPSHDRWIEIVSSLQTELDETTVIVSVLTTDAGLAHYWIGTSPSTITTFTIADLPHARWTQ